MCDSKFKKQNKYEKFEKFSELIPSNLVFLTRFNLSTCKRRSSLYFIHPISS